MSPLIKKILTQAFPILISQLLINANTLIDTAMVGHVSTLQLASLGIGMNIYISLYVPCMGILLALIPLISAAHGSKDYLKMTSLIKQGKWLALILSFLSILVMLFPDFLLNLMHASSEFEQGVKAYLKAMSIGMPAILLFQVYIAFFSCMLRPKIIMHINIMAVLLKVTLNIILIYWMSSNSATACAMATSIVSWLSVLVSFYVIHKHPEFSFYKNLKKNISFKFNEQWKILKVGFPIGLNFSVDSVFFTYTALLIAQFGAIHSAANQIISNLSYFIYLVPLSIANVSTILIAKSLGANNEKKARIIGIRVLKLGFIIHTLLTALLICFYRPLALFYTSDPNILPLTCNLIIMLGVYRFFDSFINLLGGMLRAYRKTAMTAFIYAVTLWPIGFGMGYYLAFSNYSFFQGVTGFWFSLIFSAFASCSLIFLYYQYISTKHLQQSVMPAASLSLK